MEQTKDKYILQSVANTLDLLDLLGKHGELTVPELSSLTGLSRSSVFRMLATLESKKYVQKSADAKYCLGVKPITLGSAAMSRLVVARYGHPFLVELTAKTGETSHMAVLEQDIYVRFVDKVVSQSTIHMDSAIGFRRRAHFVGCGKVLLAFQAESYVDAYINTVSFEPMTEYSLPNGDALRRELAIIKRQGYALDQEEGEYGLFCIAAPVFDSNGKAVAAISISGPTERMKRNLEAKCALVVETAARLSRSME